MRSSRKRRLGACIGFAVLALVTGAADAASSALPSGFQGVRAGMAWKDLASRGRFTDLYRPAGRWGEQVRSCGYRLLRATGPGGTLTVEVAGATVIRVSESRTLEGHAHLMAWTKAFEHRYGPPARTRLRDADGAITTDTAAARYVELVYLQPRAVTITLSGADLWTYQIDVRAPHWRLAWNDMLHCARSLGARG